MNMRLLLAPLMLTVPFIAGLDGAWCLNEAHGGLAPSVRESAVEGSRDPGMQREEVRGEIALAPEGDRNLAGKRLWGWLWLGVFTAVGFLTWGITLVAAGTETVPPNTEEHDGA